MSRTQSITTIVDALAELSITYPSKLHKPSVHALGLNPSPLDYRNFADRMEEYEAALVKHNEQLVTYKAEKARLEQRFKEILRVESSLSAEAFEVVYAKAWGDSHDEGYYAVAGTVEELEDFIMNVRKADKE